MQSRFRQCADYAEGLIDLFRTVENVGAVPDADGARRAGTQAGARPHFVLEALATHPVDSVHRDAGAHGSGGRRVNARAGNLAQAIAEIVAEEFDALMN